MADETNTEMGYSGQPPVDGEWVLVEQEITAVGKVTATGANAGTATVCRGSQVPSARAYER
ncbi:MAG: hypothetical protein AAB654_23445 [Acidobacteriota bacterium]